MMKNNDLSRNQRRALIALCTSNSLKEAAQKVSLHRRTLERYLKQDDFKVAFQELLNEVEMRALSFRYSDFKINTQVYRQIRDDPEAPPNARLRAAMYLEESVSKWYLKSVVDEAIDEAQQLANELQNKN